MAKTELTEEMRQKLSDALPFTIEKDIPFTPDYYNDFPEEFRPIFYIHPVKKKYIRGIKASDEGAALDIIHKGLSRWENLIDIGKCETIDHEGDKPTKDEIDLVPEHCLNSVMYKIIAISGMSPIDRLGLRY